MKRQTSGLFLAYKQTLYIVPRDVQTLISVYTVLSASSDSVVPHLNIIRYRMRALKARSKKKKALLGYGTTNIPRL